MDIATTLLEYGAQTNAESKAGFTPLHLSAQEGHTDMSTLLIEHQADANFGAKNGLTPLHLCAQEDRVNVAAILVKNSAETDAQTKVTTTDPGGGSDVVLTSVWLPPQSGYTPMHVACHFGQMNMVRFLLGHQTDVNSVTSQGYTPLHQAAQQGHPMIVNLLLENDASPNAVTTVSSFSLPLSLPFSPAGNCLWATAHRVFSWRGGYWTRDFSYFSCALQQGQTALSIAQKLGYITVIETLKVVTETTITTTTTVVTEEKYRVQAPETMQETFMSDSEDEGGKPLAPALSEGRRPALRWRAAAFSAPTAGPVQSLVSPRCQCPPCLLLSVEKPITDHGRRCVR